MLRAGMANAANTLIRRAGQNITIRRPDGTETDNIFGKPDDTDVSTTTVSTSEWAYRITDSENSRLGATRETGGQVSAQTPLIVLRADTQVESGDFLDFPDGSTYHIPVEPHDNVSYKLVAATLDTS